MLYAYYAQPYEYLRYKCEQKLTGLEKHTISHSSACPHHRTYSHTCSWNKVALVDTDAVAFLLQKRKQFVDNKLPVLFVAALVRQVGVICSITYKSNNYFL